MKYGTRHGKLVLYVDAVQVQAEGVQSYWRFTEHQGTCTVHPVLYAGVQ